ncbi:phosphomannomutase/phosphoglucomutase [Treponema sp.]|uniref:phosphomannomutase/phosphoglucomutase n=1 Tax=Treponema sp. TaxID=166 RepID=UPI00298E944A|nr:phosphomannomutase/phosphoglucomutase [Treponema sp.]
MEQNLMKLQNGSDVRGIALEGVADEHVNLTENACNRIGQAFAIWLSKKCGKSITDLKIGIGRDARVTGPALLKATAAGMASTGAKVYDCGLATTPAMFMSTVFDQTKYDGSAMLTASHLPFNRNGIKFFDVNGGLEHDDITDVLTIAQEKEESGTADFAGSFTLLETYAAHLKNTIAKELGAKDGDRPLSGLHIVVDAGNGDGGFFVDKILQPLGADTTGSAFLEPDGMFPNHIPNPENKDAMKAIQNATTSSKADLGLIFDTDVDRMSAVFSDGTEVNRDSIIALFSAILAPSFPGSTIITDSVTSDRLTYFLEKKLGLKHLRYMRGYKNVINKCIELNSKGEVSPLAMETSGHGALKDNYYLDDGSFLAVKLIVALAKAKKENKKIEDLIGDLPAAGVEGEYRFKIKAEDFKAYGKKVLETFKNRAEEKNFDMPESFEGIRISFHDANAEGWMLLRLSLHDPVMPLNVEGKTQKDKDAIISYAKEMIAGFDQLDVSCLD